MSYYITLSILMYFCINVVVGATNNIPKFSSILVFGDSTVDTGNNNDLIISVAKANHEPYGRDFPSHVPSGRFSNGKLVPDFIASYLNLKDTVPPYKDPNLSNDELLTGVNFASGGSGFDDYSSVFSHSIPVSNQIEYFKDYVGTIKEIVGEDKAKQILGDALVIISAGSNDVIINFYNLLTRKLEYNISGYQDFLHNNLQTYIQVGKIL
ncbi:putative triacylglycerol lipase [Lupinus albus]|uniref:Putative triacylglycerol lipase n=1 Tax=Lupinus albus TaxID=3870 RepID=A0A6A4QLJ1_LUPAL|nr:putative triacylglycerol lipase [Lupinus albus]